MKAPIYKGKSWLGAMPEIQNTPLELYPRIHQELGPVVKIKLIPGVSMYSLASPEAIEQVLRKNQKNYPKLEIFNKAVKPLTGRGLLTNKGKNWHTQRKLISPGFHHRQIARMVRVMAEETHKLADKWEQEVGKVRDISSDMMFLTLNIVSRTMFSTDVMSAAGTISEAVREAFEYTGYRLNTPFSIHEILTGKRKKKFKQAKRILDSTLENIIRDRIQQKEVGNDMLGLLLASRDEDTGKGMDHEQLIDELLTLMIAGHETTAAALSWAWYLLAKNPDKRKKLEEAVSAFSVSNLSEKAHVDLPEYAKWTFEETMRLYPPAWGVPRESKEVDTIHGFKIDKKSVINCSFYAMFRDPNLWKDAESFLPERFNQDKVPDRLKYASIPFGLGKRQCIGMNMANVEGPLLLSMLAKRFRLSLPKNSQEIEMDATFALKPKGKLMMQIVQI